MAFICMRQYACGDVIICGFAALFVWYKLCIASSIGIETFCVQLSDSFCVVQASFVFRVVL